MHQIFKLLFLVCAMYIPHLAFAQDAVERLRVEIPAIRAAGEPKIGALLRGNATGPKAESALRDAIARIGRDCKTCIITVPDEPPELTTKGASNRARLDFSAIAADNSGSVEKAEDCPVDKPFYVAAKKRCYKLNDLVIAIGAANTK